MQATMCTGERTAWRRASQPGTMVAAQPPQVCPRCGSLLIIAALMPATDRAIRASATGGASLCKLSQHLGRHSLQQLLPRLRRGTLFLRAPRTGGRTLARARRTLESGLPGGAARGCKASSSGWSRENFPQRRLPAELLRQAAQLPIHAVAVFLRRCSLHKAVAVVHRACSRQRFHIGQCDRPARGVWWRES